MGDNPDIEEMGRSRSGSARIRTRKSRSRSKTGGASSTIKRSKSPRNKEIPPDRNLAAGESREQKPRGRLIQNKKNKNKKNKKSNHKKSNNNNNNQNRDKYTRNLRKIDEYFGKLEMNVDRGFLAINNRRYILMTHGSLSMAVEAMLYNLQFIDEMEEKRKEILYSIGNLVGFDESQHIFRSKSTGRKESLTLLRYLGLGRISRIRKKEVEEEEEEEEKKKEILQYEMKSNIENHEIEFVTGFLNGFSKTKE